MSKGTCFVVMGFGIKPDLATGRKLDLDKSYRLLIKPVVEESELECVRADEICHAGSIESQMYQKLLTADLVIADLSTANPNALYELGIRHALRPRTTIVISENKLTYPFDLNHIVITSYTHLGDAIDFEEVMRFRQVLGNTIKGVLPKQETDSPVYTFLQQLTPPALREKVMDAVAEAGKALKKAGDEADNAGPAPADNNQTLAMLIRLGEEAIQGSDFDSAKSFFTSALKIGPKTELSGDVPQDHYLIQRLVLATYKAKKPDAVSALHEALELLGQLNIKETNDPETVGLAGAIEKKLFEEKQGDEHLNRSVRYYHRGYLLRDDQYNGINLAYLLNLRAASSIYSANEEKITDTVWASRVRREIIPLCQQELDTIQDQLDRMEKRIDDVDTATRIEIDKLLENQFWCLATKAEAYFGLGQLEAYEEARSSLYTLKSSPQLARFTQFAPAQWMLNSFTDQISKLQQALANVSLQPV